MCVVYCAFSIFILFTYWFDYYPVCNNNNNIKELFFFVLLHKVNQFSTHHSDWNFISNIFEYYQSKIDPAILY